MQTTQTECLDFDVHIGERSGSGYPVRVRSPGGEPKGDLELPYDEATLDRHIAGLAARRRRDARASREVERADDAGDAPDENDDLPQRFGTALFAALLGGSVATAYRLSRDRATREGKGLRIRLRIDAAEVAALPWELLYDEAEGDFVALSRSTPLVRYLELDLPPSPVPAAMPLRVLGMIALPTDVAQLEASAERQRIEHEFSALVAGGQVELHWVDGQTWRDLQRTMRVGAWNVFHFVGHGSAALGAPSIVLCDDAGRSAPLAADELGRLLKGQSALGLVVLNACEGAQGDREGRFRSLAATLVGRGLPAVIAMQHEVSDPGAISFAREFYAAVADGFPVDLALAESRIASSLENRQSAEWATPVLMMRAPHGKLFDFGTSAAPAHVAPPTHDMEHFPEIPGTTGKGWGKAMAAIGLALLFYIAFLFISSQS